MGCSERYFKSCYCYWPINVQSPLVVASEAWLGVASRNPQKREKGVQGSPPGIQVKERDKKSSNKKKRREGRFRGFPPGIK
jgi:hypothetical protein